MGTGSKRERRRGGLWGLFRSRGTGKISWDIKLSGGALNERQNLKGGMMIKRDRWRRGTF